MKTTIFYISYKTCESLTKYKNSFQLTNSKTFIATNVTFHIFQLTFLVLYFQDKKVKTFNDNHILFFLGMYLISIGLITFIFDKKTLAKSISKFKNTQLTKYARLIGLTYFILNLVLLYFSYGLQIK